MADKISEYPEKTVFNNDDLMDISSFQDVGSYVSEKSTLLQVVDYIKTKVGIYGVDGTIGTGRIATLTDNLKFRLGASFALFISGSGVGVGTETINERLNVNGSVFLTNRTEELTTPVGGGTIYVSGGALKYIGSSGTITILGAA